MPQVTLQEVCTTTTAWEETLSLRNVVERLTVMVQASSINSVDAAKLTVLVQNAQGSGGGDDLDAVGARAAVAYQSHGGAIVETLVDLKAVLGELAASQAAMTKLRAKKKDAFARNEQDGIDGVRPVLGVLRDYYGGGDKAHEAAGEENTGIIGLRGLGQVAGFHCTEYLLSGRVIPTSLAELSCGGLSGQEQRR